MARPANPLEAKKKDSEKLRKYLAAANEFWMEAVQLQASRCAKAHEGKRDFVADVASAGPTSRIYVTSLSTFSPESDHGAGHFGISFMPGSIVDLKPSGEVDYLIDVRDAAPSVSALNQRLADALKPSP
jgi:hypothetical protein